LCIALVLVSPATAAAPQTDETLTWSDTVVVPYYVPTPWRPEIDLYGPFQVSVRCSCVLYAQTVLGLPGPWGYPNKMATSSEDPYEGGLMLTTEGSLGHVAVITSVSAETLTVTEANYSRCSITSRTVPRTASFIRGFR
jgi:hypothetical protein